MFADGHEPFKNAGRRRSQRRRAARVAAPLAVPIALGVTLGVILAVSARPPVTHVNQQMSATSQAVSRSSPTAAPAGIAPRQSCDAGSSPGAASAWCPSASASP